MTRKLVVLATGVLALTAGGAAFYRGAGADGDLRPITGPVTRGAVVQTVDASGTLEAVTTVAVGTQVSGTIKALYADYNSQVRKGQVVAQLEPSLFATQVEQARATVQRLRAEVDASRVRLEDAEVKLRRAEELSARQLIAAVDLETAQATARAADASLKAAEAQLVQGRAAFNQAEVNLGHATITAPIDGIVISRSVDVGQTVAASMSAPTLFVLAQDLRRMQVNASVDESDIGRIEPGQRVEFRVDAYPEGRFAGTVRQVRLEPVIEQNVVSYVTVIDVPNPDLRLRPGMTAMVTIEIARADDVLRVPNAALRFRPAADVLASLGSTEGARQGAARTDAGRARDQAPVGGSERSSVWVLREGRLARVPVRAGISDGAATAVTSAELRDGAEVVTGLAGSGVAPAQPAASPLLPQRPGGRARTQAEGRR